MQRGEDVGRKKRAKAMEDELSNNLRETVRLLGVSLMGGGREGYFGGRGISGSWRSIKRRAKD